MPDKSTLSLAFEKKRVAIQTRAVEYVYRWVGERERGREIERER